MKFTRAVKLLSIFILSFASSQLFAATYIVGTCRAGHQFPTIQAALDAVSTPDTTVLICPGSYFEQIWITKGVDLRGLTTNDSSRVYISTPSAGLQGNDVDNNGNIVAAHIRATDAMGPVNISNIVVQVAFTDSPYNVAGIFYRNSSGSINHATVQSSGASTRSQTAIWIEGGGSNPSVTVENSSVKNINMLNGIVIGELSTSAQPTSLSATVRGNFFSASLPQTGIRYIYLASCDSCITTVTGNTMFGGGTGIEMISGTGAVIANKLVNNAYGLGIVGGSYKATGNTIFANYVTGIGIFATNSSSIEHNSIVNTPIGIDFFCHADGNVRANVIEDAQTGLNKVPAGISSTNTYANVFVIKTGC